MAMSTQARRWALGGAAAASVLALGLASAPIAGAEGPAPVAMSHVEDFRLADQEFLARRLYKMADAKAIVLVSYAAGDAVVKADTPAWMALKAAYADKGVEFLAIDSKLGETRPKVVADAAAIGLKMPILFDYEQLVGEGLSLTKTAEVIVVDPRNWSVAYRGPATGPGGEAWAKTAVEGLVSGQKVAMPAQVARGASIAFPEAA